MAEEGRQIAAWLAALSEDTYFNVMDQYYPAWKARTDQRYSDIGRRVYPEEISEVYEGARKAGLWRFDTRWRRVPPTRIPLAAADGFN